MKTLLLIALSVGTLAAGVPVANADIVVRHHHHRHHLRHHHIVIIHRN